MNKTKGFLAILATAIIFGGAFGPFIRELATTFSNSGSVLVRSFCALLIMVVIICVKRVNVIAFNRKNAIYLVLFSLAFAVSIFFFTTAANAIKVSTSLFMLYVGLLSSTAFFGKVLFREKFSLKHILSLVLVFLGLSFFVVPNGIESFSLAVFLAIAAGALEGAVHTLRKLMIGLSREVVVFYQSLSGVVLGVFFIVTKSEPVLAHPENLNFKVILVTVIYGALLALIGYLLAYGYQNFDVNLGTIVLSTEVFFALLTSYIFLHESPTLYEFIGGILIFAGSIVTSLSIGFKTKEIVKA